jgi:hypothetical protein
MYYLVTSIAVDSEQLDSLVFIQTVPPESAITGDEQVSGYLGVRYERHITAHGEFTALDAAIRYMREALGPVELIDDTTLLNDAVLLMYRQRGLKAVTPEQAADILSEMLATRVSKSTWSMDLVEMSGAFEAMLNSAGVTFANFNVLTAMEVYRDSLRGRFQ